MKKEMDPLLNSIKDFPLASIIAVPLLAGLSLNRTISFEEAVPELLQYKGVPSPIFFVLILTLKLFPSLTELGFAVKLTVF